jgi:hypothetical protein
MSVGKTFADLMPGDLRLIALSALGRTLHFLSMSDDSGAATVRREPPPLLRLQTEEELAAEVRDLVNRVREDRPLVRPRLSSVNGLVQRILDATDIRTSYERLKEARDLSAKLLAHELDPATGKFVSLADGGRLRLESVVAFEPDEDIAEALNRDIAEGQFLASVMQMCREYRSQRRAFSPEDELALERAYRLLDQGVRMPRNYQSIRTDDHRPVQTYLSFADSGEGHLAVTVRESALLEGLIAHVEYIDRDNVDRKELVEAYRLPAVRNAARVRLHVGSSTPCTAFIGRPVFEANSFDLGLLKAGHTMASVCSAMFAHGLADCKVAMDGMTARQTVEFMRVVAGNVVRDPLKQRLSAAFNINTSLLNDLVSRGAPRKIEPSIGDETERNKSRFEIAELAVRLVKLGGFNKVAWDGASDERPSKPIIGQQLSRVQLLKVVHSAHEHGLETYISAGMTDEHMWDAVFIGVGGVGVGTSLHSKADGVVGEIDRAKVLRILDVQKEALKTTAGRAASQLAQLDWRYAEGSLTRAGNDLRTKLFEELKGLLQSMDDGKVTITQISSATQQQLESLLNNIKAIIPEQGYAPGRTIPKGYLREKAVLVEKGAGIKGGDVERMALDSISADATWSDDPAVGWARRVLNAQTQGTMEGNGMFGEDTIKQIKRMFEAKDLHGLRRLYPL